eukprot:3872108-Prymnesium_polylepis.1
MFTARVTSGPGRRHKVRHSAETLVGVQHPTCFTFTPPYTPRGPLSAILTPQMLNVKEETVLNG